MKLAILVDGDLKAPFSIATTPRFWGGRYSFPGLLHFTLDPYLIMVSFKQGGMMIRVLANGPGDLGSIPDRVIPKTRKTVLDVALLTTMLQSV